MLRCWSPFQSLLSNHICRTLMQMRRGTVAVHCRWYRSLLTPATLAVESPKDLCSFSLNGTIFLSIPSHFDHNQLSRSQYFTSTNHLSCGFYHNFYWRLASKSLHVLSDLRLVPRLWRRTLQLLLMHIVFRSLLKIFVYTAKQACKQLQCNKAKLLEPINGLHNQKGLG